MRNMPTGNKFKCLLSLAPDIDTIRNSGAAVAFRFLGSFFTRAPARKM